ncbi:TPA: hypothetical protein KOX39_003430 [Clostridioides difficile]|nr:hypothetical protein [Clostridioides difficile]
MSKAKKTFNSINNKFSNEVEQLIKTAPDLEIKHKLIEDITERYYQEVGEQIPNYMINLLTEWYLSGELKSKDVDKVSKTEYPILSKHQIIRRSKKHPVMDGEVLDFLNQTRGRKTKKTTKEKDR